MITVDRVTKKYKSGVGDAPVVKDVDLTLPNTGMCVILGRSGSGKSTLLNMLGGIISDYSGSITVDGENTTDFSEQQWCRFRSKYYGVVFQDFNLLEDCSVWDNLMLPLNILQKSKNEIDAAIDAALDAVGMAEYKYQRVCRLSGGQKQRIAIARALVKRPKILLADEPTGNLDSKTSDAIFSLLKQISNDCLIIVATHDTSAANEYADILLEIKDGVLYRHSDSDILFDYSIMRNGNPIKSAQEYSAKNLIGDLTDILNLQLSTELENGNIDIRITQSIKKIDAATNEKQVVAEEKSDNQVIPLKLSKAFGYAYSNIKQKTVRSGFVILLNAILIVFLAFAVNLLRYRSSLTLNAYNRRYEPKYLTVEKHYMYEDSFFQIHDSVLSAGKEFFDTVGSVTNPDSVCPVIYNAQAYVNDYYTHGIRLLVPRNLEYFEPFLLNGRLPESEEEIVLTDFIADQMGLSIDSAIEIEVINGCTELRVVGIMKTDYQEYGIVEKIALMRTTEYSDYKLQEEYYVGIVNESYCESLQKNAALLDLPRSDILLSKFESRFINSNMIYGSSESISDEMLLCGAMPKSHDEILVSIDVALQMYMDIESFETISGQFIDLHASEYHGVYSDTLNIFEYFKDGYKIVGVFSLPYQQGDVPAVLVDGAVFSALKKDFFSNYIFDRSCILNENVACKEFDGLFAAGVRWTDVSAKKIYDFEAALKSLDMYLKLAAFLISVGIIATFILLISYSIRDRASLIGIMKTIGYTGGDINRIFAAETLLIGVVSVIIANALFLCIKAAANNSYASKLLEYPFKLLIFEPKYMCIVSFACLAACILSGAITIYRMLFKKAFDLIHGE